MNLPRNPIPMDNQFGPEAQFFSNQQQFQPPLQQQQQQFQQAPPQNRQFKENNPPRNDNGQEFFGKFGNYDAHKSKLNKDLHNEYNEYLQQKNANNRRNNNNNRQQGSDDYYATLPLKGMESSKVNYCLILYYFFASMFVQLRENTNPNNLLVIIFYPILIIFTI